MARNKSAVSGLFVSDKEAKNNPRETYTVRKKKKKPSKKKK